jgi:hypothetical protein
MFNFKLLNNFNIFYLIKKYFSWQIFLNEVILASRWKEIDKYEGI